MDPFLTRPFLNFLPLVSDPLPLLYSGPLHYPSSPSPPDYFDCLPDPILLLILNRVHDLRSLGRFTTLSRRFRSLIPLVDRLHVAIDRVIPSDQSPVCHPTGAAGRGGGIFSHALCSLRNLLSPSRRLVNLNSDLGTDSCVTHHSPEEVLRNFEELKFLRIELPGGELGLDEGVVLQWKAEFGSTLENCTIFAASNVYDSENEILTPNPNPNSHESISNDVFKLRVVWTISALIAASARHYLLKTIISSHKTLKELVLTDQDQQGELTMDENQLKDFKTRPVLSTSGSLRTVIPALSIKLWYMNWLEVPNGRKFEGATLMAVRPSGVADLKDEWVLDAFDDVECKSAVKMLLEKRNYCLEMNSF